MRRKPILSKIEIYNFKCIHDLTLEFSPLTVLIGKNDTGKTSILEAVGLIAGSNENDDRIWSRNEEPPLFVRQGIKPSDCQVHAMIGTETCGRNLSLEGRLEDSPPQELRALYGVVPPYHLDIQELRKPAVVGVLKQRPLPATGRGFAAAVDRLPHKIFSEVQKEYSSRIPLVNEIRCDADPDYEGSKRVAFEVAGEGVIDASMMSDGALLILAYLVIANDEHRPPLIMIEEPENGIHPRQLQGVMELFKSLTTGENPVQVIMTTHSPFVLDCVPPESVRVCTRDEEHGVQVHNFSEEEPIKSLLAEGFTLGEAWFNVDEDLIGKTAK